MFRGMCLNLCECVIDNDSDFSQNQNQINSNLGTVLSSWLESLATSAFKGLALKFNFSSLRGVMGMCIMPLVSLWTTLLSLTGNKQGNYTSGFIFN